MAEAAEQETREDEREPAAPRGSKANLLIILTLALVLVLVLLLGGGVAGLYLAGVGPFAQHGTEAGDPAAEEEGVSKGPAIYVDIPPAFTVNLLGDSKARFLQVSVQALTRESDVEASIKEHLPMIRNKLVLLFSGKTSQELGTREGKETLRKEAKTAIQSVLKSETGKGGVEAVFFTSFVMQ
jgi:flagellar FliL protein